MNRKWLITAMILGVFNSRSISAWTVSNEGIRKPLPGQDLVIKHISTETEPSEQVIAPKSFPQTQSKLTQKTRSAKLSPRILDLPNRSKLSAKKNHSQVSEVDPAPEFGQSFEKQLSNLNGEEQATLNYIQALEFINNGIDDKAEELFLNNLTASPNHIASRVELANLYLKVNQDLDAEQLVNEGLKLQNHPELLKLMAIIMERRGDLNIALDYLNKIPPQHKNDKNTVVLLGHIYQRTGHFGLAKNQYERLMEADPNNPLWLLGVTMAIDGEGKKSEALKGYLKLQSSPTLDSSVQQYISQRIASLKG